MLTTLTRVLAEWTPPTHPNPFEILKEADADVSAGKYADALEKHVWFHENALKIDQSFYGVRLSFALSGWVKLGKKYQPALEKLKSIRDAAGKNIRDKKSARIFNDFGDYE